MSHCPNSSVLFWKPVAILGRLHGHGVEPSPNFFQSYQTISGCETAFECHRNLLKRKRIWGTALTFLTFSHYSDSDFNVLRNEVRILENKIVILRKKVGILKVNIVGNLRKSQNCGEKKSKILGKKLELREKKKSEFFGKKVLILRNKVKIVRLKVRVVQIKKKGRTHPLPYDDKHFSHEISVLVQNEQCRRYHKPIRWLFICACES